ncbi:MAG TPA: hypothetical protein VFC45_13705 [Pseudolabrys sp.]|nr:hypothetical protein [Pseudolabrys sp.]
MANLAGFAGIAIVCVAVFGFLEVLDLLQFTGPQLPPWANKVLGLFIAGFILSLLVTAFSTGKSWYQRGKPPWAKGEVAGKDATGERVVARQKLPLALIAVGVVGIFFLASGFQTVGTNMFGQFCPGTLAGCWHPEWIAIGSGLMVVCFILWKRRGSL